MPFQMHFKFTTPAPPAAIPHYHITFSTLLELKLKFGTLKTQDPYLGRVIYTHATLTKN